jgi:hypothetical protein
MPENGYRHGLRGHNNDLRKHRFKLVLKYVVCGIVAMICQYIRRVYTIVEPVYCFLSMAKAKAASFFPI